MALRKDGMRRLDKNVTFDPSQSQSNSQNDENVVFSMEEIEKLRELENSLEALKEINNKLSSSKLRRAVL